MVERSNSDEARPHGVKLDDRRARLGRATLADANREGDKLSYEFHETQKQ